MPNFSGEHALVTGIMVLAILGAVVTISLVMFWAPSRPFPNPRTPAEKRPNVNSKISSKPKRKR